MSVKSLLVIFYIVNASIQIVCGHVNSESLAVRKSNSREFDENYLEGAITNLEHIAIFNLQKKYELK
jgi:hypothetical protein